MTPYDASRKTGQCLYIWDNATGCADLHFQQPDQLPLLCIYTAFLLTHISPLTMIAQSHPAVTSAFTGRVSCSNRRPLVCSAQQRSDVPTLAERCTSAVLSAAVAASMVGCNELQNLPSNDLDAATGHLTNPVNGIANCVWYRPSTSLPTSSPVTPTHIVFMTCTCRWHLPLWLLLHVHLSRSRGLLVPSALRSSFRREAPLKPCAQV